MSLFEDKPKKARNKDASLQSLRRKIVKAREEWLAEFLEPTGGLSSDAVMRYVDRVLSDRFEHIIERTVGIEWSGSNRALRYNSPLGEMIDTAARTMAQEVAARLIAVLREKFLNAPLPTRFRRSLIKEYEEKYQEALWREVAELGEKDAKKDAEAIFKKALGVSTEIVEESGRTVARMLNRKQDGDE